jgi:hypothetical protein
VAQKKLLSFREWQQIVRERKVRAAQRRAQAKHARLAAWWASPADRNYVELTAYWVGPQARDVLYGRQGLPLGPEGICVQGRILPDKRREPRQRTKLEVRLTVPGQADRQEIANQLVQLAAVVLNSDEPWQTASGEPLARPVSFEGFPIRITPQQPWRADADQQAGAAVAPLPRAPRGSTMDRSPLQGLMALREDLGAWLSAHRQEGSSVLRHHTLEELTEVLVMLVCGQEIALLSDRDPWRFEHSAEELQATEEVCEWAIARLRATVLELGTQMSPEAVIDVLLTVFVEGRR